MFDLSEFINEYVTKRPESLFLDDIKDNLDALKAAIKGKTVLVIGGAGSIGSSFIKAILPFEPSSLVIVDINENALTELTRDLRSSGMFMPGEYLSYPMDYHSITFKRMFRNRKRSNGLSGFDIVANFSAHKHVRSEKDIYSVEALLRNNVINARGLLELLSEYPPDEYFCVSTDKAANPVNIMGASKRIMEDLIFSFSDIFPVKTARFANVAFSNGSLPAGFLDRISKTQPLSAPFDVRRYFVSPEESGQICMLSCMLGSNREIFFPKLKEAQMMTFDEIARNLLKVQGYNVRECSSEAEAIALAENLGSGSKDYPVFFAGSDTSGEKSYEEFYTSDEKKDFERYRSLGVIMGKERPDVERLRALISKIEDAFEMDNVTKSDIVKIISDYLPDFAHIETGRSLDEKM